MPIGVEHKQEISFKSQTKEVSLPVMPIGVEHKLGKLSIAVMRCVATCDADRR